MNTFEPDNALPSIPDSDAHLRRPWNPPHLQPLSIGVSTLKGLGCGEGIDKTIKTSTCS